MNASTNLENLIRALIDAHCAGLTASATEIADAIFSAAPVPGVRVPDIAFVHATPTPYGQAS